VRCVSGKYLAQYENHLEENTEVHLSPKLSNSLLLLEERFGVSEGLGIEVINEKNLTPNPSPSRMKV
jgi:hypothetical protein